MKDSEAMSRGARDGEKLLRIMKEAGVRQTALAREMGKTPTSIARYIAQLNTGELSEENWLTMSSALRRLGLGDALEGLRPALRAPPQPQILTDLVPLIDHFATPVQLEALLQIIEGHPGSQEILKLLIREKLKHIG